MKSPEWRWQRRRADLRHFEIFRHGPIIIHTRLPAGGTYYPNAICTFPASSECLIGISDAFSAFCLRVSVVFPTCSLYPSKSVPTLHYTRRHEPIYTGPCPKALTECSPLDFRRSSIVVLSCDGCHSNQTRAARIGELINVAAVPKLPVGCQGLSIGITGQDTEWQGGNKLYVAATDRTYNDRVAINYMWQQQTGHTMTGWQ